MSEKHQPAPLGVTIRDACHIGCLSRSELYRALARGDIQAVKRGRTTVILYGSLVGFIARLPPASFKPSSAL